VVCSLASGGSSWWHLEAVAITALASGHTTWFYADRVFGSAGAGGGLDATLQGAEEDLRAQLVQYKVGASRLRALVAYAAQRARPDRPPAAPAAAPHHACCNAGCR
jgi:hypothetical protein